jgi:hypothetical protein
VAKAALKISSLPQTKTQSNQGFTQARSAICCALSLGHCGDAVSHFVHNRNVIVKPADYAEMMEYYQ